MTIELNTHSLTRTHKNTHPHRQTDRGSVEESKREEIISKQTTTTKHSVEQQQV